MVYQLFGRPKIEHIIRIKKYLGNYFAKYAVKHKIGTPIYCFLPHHEAITENKVFIQASFTTIHVIFQLLKTSHHPQTLNMFRFQTDVNRAVFDSIPERQKHFFEGVVYRKVR